MSESSEKKVGQLGLVALTVTAVVGSGVFNLMKDMAMIASVGSIILALLISGLGMGLFVFCLQQMNEKYPHLEAGIYSYAEAGLGPFVGFLSALGYWLSIFIGNVAFATITMSALGYFFPLFEDGQNVSSVIAASLLMWGMHGLILRGSDFASKINTLITLAKLVPLVIFIGVVIIAFDYGLFTQDFWGTGAVGFQWSEVTFQVKKALASAVWVFVGVEGAVVYSARAKNKQVIGRSIALSFALITSIYLLATVLSFAVMSQGDIAALDKPAMAGVLDRVVGQWGSILINVGVVISSLGAWFACTMLSGEITYQAAHHHIFPKVFAKENKNQAPVNALIISNSLVQLFLLSLLINESAYNFTALLASSTMLVPYFFVSLSFSELSLHWTGKRISLSSLLGVLSTFYMGYCMYASGWDYILVTSLLFAPGMILYIIARKEKGLDNIFSPREAIGAVIILVLAGLTIYLIVSGHIHLGTM